MRKNGGAGFLKKYLDEKYEVLIPKYPKAKLTFVIPVTATASGYGSRLELKAIPKIYRYGF